MAGETINLVHDARKLAQAMARAPGTVLPEMDAALYRGGIELSRKARDEAPKYRSELANSIMPERVSLLTVMVAARGKTYGPYVEEGTAAGGEPPLAELERWIALKRITPRKAGMSTRSLAYLIQRSIAFRGIRANPFMARSLAAMRPRLLQLLDQGLDSGLAKAGLT